MKSLKSLSQVAQELEAIRTGMQEIRAKLDRLADLPRTSPPTPHLFSLHDAAKELGISLSSVKRLVATKAISTVELGARRMVPRSEIERVSRPPSPKSAVVRQSPRRVVTESEKIRSKYKRR